MEVVLQNALPLMTAISAAQNVRGGMFIITVLWCVPFGMLWGACNSLYFMILMFSWIVKYNCKCDRAVQNNYVKSL